MSTPPSSDAKQTFFVTVVVAFFIAGLAFNAMAPQCGSDSMCMSSMMTTGSSFMMIAAIVAMACMGMMFFRKGRFALFK